MQNLKGKTVAILATDGFEYSELIEPKRALEAAGANPVIVSVRVGEIKGWKDGDWYGTAVVDQSLDQAYADDFDALVLPGGVINPDRMRSYPQAAAFVRAFMNAGKPVAAICHGPWMLVEAGVLQGRKATSWPSIRTDVENAGAVWTDEAVVVDHGLVTSRRPSDLEAFNRQMIAEIAEGPHRPRTGRAQATVL